jgi:hypothetical protein
VGEISSFHLTSMFGRTLFCLTIDSHQSIEQSIGHFITSHCSYAGIKEGLSWVILAQR